MFAYRRLRRKQIVREAEGYLDLATVFAERWPLRADLRDRLAQRALACLGRLDSAAADKAPAGYLRGQALRIMERHQEAIRSLRRSAELDPANVRTWLALGWCYKRTGRLDLAIRALEEAVAVDEGQAVVFYNLACYWSLAHNAAAALDCLARAFHIDPSYRDLVAEEPDFDPIRDHPGFRRITRVVV